MIRFFTPMESFLVVQSRSSKCKAMRTRRSMPWRSSRMHAVEWTKTPLGAIASWNLRRADGPVISFRPALAGYNTDVTIAALTNEDVALAWDSSVATAFLWEGGRASRVNVVTPGITITSIRTMNDARVIIGTGRVEGKAGQVPVILRPLGR